MNDGALRRVTIFGGGIAGLTAAHELAERGFAVQLVECAADPDAHGRPQLAIGGLARSQYRRVPLGSTRAELDAAARGSSVPRAAERLARPSVYPIHLTGDGEGRCAPSEIGRAALAELAVHLRGELADYSVRIAGDGDGARAAAALLIGAGVAAGRVAVESSAADTPVEVCLVESLLPGEHGFRFFPAFYRHLADTMRRTPLGDGRSALDNLLPVETQLFTRPGHTPTALGRGGRQSVEAVRKELGEWLRAVGFSSRDVAWYALRLLRYVTSCTGRRAQKYEALSWWDFLTLRHLDAPGERLPYSERTLDFLRHTPRALVAMDPLHCDARTQGNMLVQLLRDQLMGEGPIDATLNGPTSSAWLIPWRRHLERLGVRFFLGRLTALGEPQVTEGGRLRVAPEVEEAAPGGLAGYVATADYYILALDLVAAQRVTSRLATWARERCVAAGVVSELQPFALTVPEPSGGPARARDPETETGASAWDRLQTLTGIQFYFGQRVELAKGYVYYTESPWALTSIGHSFRWRQAPTLARDGYLALHSVDIGDFPRELWRLTKTEIARESLRQIRSGIAGAGPDRLPAPLFYHLDDGLEFAAGPDGPGAGPLIKNRTPYLINIAGDWTRRPGQDPWDPRRPAGTTSPQRTELLWQSAQGGYAIHFDQIVFAGTWLRTFTRLTSMEAANESARHAVNAILTHAQSELVGGDLPTPPTPRSYCVPSRLGDFCDVWDPERHELDELDFLRRIDESLLGRELPHLFDILELDALPAALRVDQPDPVKAILRHIADVLDRALLTDGQVVGVESAVRRLGRLLREQLE